MPFDIHKNEPLGNENMEINNTIKVGLVPPEDS